MVKADDPVHSHNVRDDVVGQHDVETDVAKLLVVAGQVSVEAAVQI